VDFTPPEITFDFEYELKFILYTPPTVTLTIGFNFGASVRPSFVLDTAGIREAVEQKSPEKALNSFALRDTIGGIDVPLVQ